ncbi:MAG: DUF4199 domain-containing protein, partial [Cytophagales bacterium]|nr:DUF4199 domain-containing protein [Cytophagales bacterium]
GQNPLGNLKIISSAPCFLVAYWGIKKYRNDHPDGIVKISSLYLYGLYVNALIGAITGIFVFAFLQFIDPSVAEVHIQGLKEFIQQNSVYTAEAKASLLKDVEKTTAVDLGIDEVIKRIGSGFFYVLLAAAIVRR